MCRSANNPQGKRRCPAQSDPAKKAAYNARRRQRYQELKGASAPEFSSTPDFAYMSEDELFSEENVDMYMNGECYRLANSLYALGRAEGYPWKFVSIVPDSEGMEGQWVHMAVLTEKNELLDMDGLNNLNEIVYANQNFLEERWDYEVQSMHARKTGEKDYSVKAKMVAIENDAQYQKMIKGQGQGYVTDDMAADFAKHLFAWYQQQNLT